MSASVSKRYDLVITRVQCSMVEKATSESNGVGFMSKSRAGCSVIFVNENENENDEKRENNEFVNEN